MEKELLESLKEFNLTEESRLQEIFDESQERGKDFGDLLVERDIISRENLGRIAADILNLPFFDKENTAIDIEVLKVIPEKVARKQKIIAFSGSKKGLKVATADPSNKEIIDFLEKKTGLKVEIFYTTEDSIIDSLALYTVDTKKSFDKIISEAAPGTDPPVQKIVDEIIEHGYRNKASDIHIEPLEKETLIRFRMDGVLHDMVILPEGLHQQIITRIKVMADLQTDEHLKPQDGKINVQTSLEEVDLRVSIVPITEGEKAVLRLLSERSRQFSLRSLGLAEESFTRVEKAYQQPHGMILVTGPTGSGKTTTLYSIIKLLNKRDVNITTIEDPVEYSIKGINQIQTNQRTGLTFAKGLRSLVRQDPDVILVGEIRDEETAGIAINSAMTGHLVLSSLHTNNASTAIPRFIDLNIEPFLIASTINVVVAQRLVRKICPNCRVSKEVEKSKIQEEFTKYFNGKEEIRLYYGKGCSLCHDSGYRGRIGIFEVLVMNDNIREAIIKKDDAEKIQNLAIEGGMTTMFEDGIHKIKNGITTLEEVVRVTKI